MTVRPTARWAVGVAAAALLLGAAGCTQDPNSVAAQAKAGDQKGYVSGDGAVETIPADKRAEPVELKGTLLDGSSWDAASTRGKVLVLNVWGSWCGPCRTEAPDLQFVATQSKVAVLGINVRDDAQAARDFTHSAGISYDSISDYPGRSLAGLGGVPRNVVPLTVVLDKQHRVAFVSLVPVQVAKLVPLVQRLAME